MTAASGRGLVATSTTRRRHSVRGCSVPRKGFVHGFAPREHASSRGLCKQPHTHCIARRNGVATCGFGRCETWRSVLAALRDAFPATTKCRTQTRTKVPISFASLVTVVPLGWFPFLPVSRSVTARKDIDGKDSPSARPAVRGRGILQWSGSVRRGLC